MTESPGSVLRKAVAKLNPEIPGVQFRVIAANKAADIIDAYWQEVAEINAGGDKDRQGSAYMTISHLLASILTGTVGHFQDRDGIANTIVALAVFIADCEMYLDHDLIPPREVVDAATDSVWFEPLSEDLH